MAEVQTNDIEFCAFVDYPVANSISRKRGDQKMNPRTLRGENNAFGPMLHMPREHQGAVLLREGAS